MTPPVTGQAAAELAFAKSMGWHDWTWDEESKEGMVRGYRVQWSPDANAGLIVYDEDDEDARYVLVTGEPPTLTVRGWTTVREAKATGWKIGEGWWARRSRCPARRDSRTRWR